MFGCVGGPGGFPVRKGGLLWPIGVTDSGSAQSHQVCSMGEDLFGLGGGPDAAGCDQGDVGAQGFAEPGGEHLFGVWVFGRGLEAVPVGHVDEICTVLGEPLGEFEGVVQVDPLFWDLGGDADAYQESVWGGVLGCSQDATGEAGAVC